MAIATPGSLVGALSGKVAGVTFVSRGSQIVVRRSQPTPIDKPGDRLARRSAVAYMHAQWSALTSAQRLQWSEVAANFPATSRLGTPLRLSGWNLFLKLNLERWPNSACKYLTAPSTRRSTQPTSAEAEASATSTCTVFVYGIGSPTGSLAAVWCTNPFIPQPEHPDAHWAYLGMPTFSFYSLSVGSLITARWGSMINGQKFWGRVSYFQSDLLPSTPITFPIWPVAP